MASTRTMFQNDSWPPLRGQATDETGVLDLSSAVSLEVIIDAVGGPALTAGPGGSAVQITGTAVADTPPIDDADHVHHWNWHYNWHASPPDTQYIGDYEVYLKVTWSSTGIETFGPDSLSIVAAP